MIVNSAPSNRTGAALGFFFSLTLIGCPSDPVSGPRPGEETSLSACDDGTDNDGDLAVDCADPDCEIHCQRDGSRADRTAMDGGFLACAESTTNAAAAFAPVDVIWAVDTSGSMIEEAAIVQDNLNDLSASLSGEGVQTRLILITGRSFVRVPPPLSSDAARFLHLPVPINSREVFSTILSEFDNYSAILRPAGPTHVVVVSDDNDEMPASEFRAALSARLGHDFEFHAIASEVAEHDCRPAPGGGELCRPGCEGPFGAATAIGAAYFELAIATSGTTFSICTGDWSPLFSQLRERVREGADLPCRYELPEAPPGETLDPAKVNVMFRDGDGPEEVFLKTNSAATCGENQAWYYDDEGAPTQVVLCPRACERTVGLSERALQIVLGCESQLI